MFANGTIVEVYEDPLTMARKEGNARVIEHVLELEPGVDQYKVNFIGDDPEMVVVRTVASDPICSCCDSHHEGDDENCPVHGKVVEHVSAN